MKKFLALMLAAALVLSTLAACTNTPAETTPEATEGTTEKATEADTTEKATEADTTETEADDETADEGGEDEGDDEADDETADEGGEDEGDEEGDDEGDEEEFDEEEYDKISDEVYEKVLGEFYATYQNAMDPELSASESWVYQAIAEAKLLESGVFIPLSADGGNYAISRIVPRTVTNTPYGYDDERFTKVLITNEEPWSAAEIQEMRDKWAELAGTGTYHEWAKQYVADKGRTLNDTYNLLYTSDPKTWDMFATSRAADSQFIAKTLVGLLPYDEENNQQPALAEALPEVSEDRLTYTFKLKQGVKWVDSQGRELGEVTAQDFVDGLEHLLTAGGGLESLIFGKVKGALEFYSGECGIEDVGVKAVDKYTVEYTLEAPCNYFLSMFSYSLFLPFFKEYADSQGDAYGTDPDHIAYNGPYLCTNWTQENSVIFKANPAYYDADSLEIKNINYSFNDGNDVLRAYNETVAGTLPGTGLNTSAAAAAKDDGNLEKYGYEVVAGATSYVGFLNVNRMQFENINDGAIPSPQTEEDAARTNQALQNQAFRQALLYSLDRVNYNGQVVGDDLAAVSVTNSYVPGNFVHLQEDVTVELGGEEVTFKAGDAYGVVLQAALDADNMGVKVWDPTLDGGLGASTGFDGWFNPEKAAEKFAQAVEELAAEGLEITADAPIQLDLPTSVREDYQNRSQVFKQAIEKASDGLVQVNVVQCASNEEWYYAGYWTDYGYEANYDIYDLSGWGPDYLDPSTYLDTMLPDYDGYMVKCIGIY